MWSMLWPVALIVLTNVFYNIFTKSTPPEASASLSLTVTYAVAAVFSFLIYFIQGGRQLSADLPKLNWTAAALGAVIVGLEMGYIYAFRAGWKVNVCSIVANISLAAVLVLVGLFLFGESISPRQLLGIAVCAAGLALITL